MTDVTQFEGIPLLSGLNRDEMQQVSDAARPLMLERGQVLFAQNDDSTELFVVGSGRIAITRGFIDGRESVLALMEAGDLFGEMGMFGDDEASAGRSADARALERCEVTAIPYSVLRDVWDARPELLWTVVSLLAERLRVTDEALADSMFLDVAGRTAKRLLELSGGEEIFTLPVTQEELAGMVGASRERVNKALASFGRLGWVEQTDRRYRILDRDALERRAS
ncbi:MAG: Crp/Fnr family transcriptional regulator [Actinomycetota bacterium]